MRLFLIISILALSALSSCRLVEEAEAEPERYFDLKGFINEDTGRISSSSTVYLKNVRLDGDQELDTLKNIDWAKEIRLWERVDINKPAWIGKYQADTTSSGISKTITYTALDTDLRTQKLSIHFVEDVVDSIFAFQQTDNLLYHLEQEMHYLPDRGMRISAKQKIRFLKEREYGVEIFWM